jgi:thiamine-phosphate pyrophosphorylase
VRNAPAETVNSGSAEPDQVNTCEGNKSNYVSGDTHALLMAAHIHYSSVLLTSHIRLILECAMSVSEKISCGESHFIHPFEGPAFPATAQRLGLYPVVDTVEWIERLLSVGVRTIQLRIKDKSDLDVESQIAAAIALGQRYNARLFINDYWRLAIKYGAYGVHLGQDDLDRADLAAISTAGLRLGISTHDNMEMDRALSVKPSYIALGHVFPTQTKQMPSSPQGLSKLAEHIQALGHYPTVAIGGISLERARDVLATGVGSIAVVSAITQATDWHEATQQLLQLAGVGDE